MKQYTKPMISIDNGMAEGVYAASGAASNDISISEKTVVADWGSDNGQAKFTLTLSNKLIGSKLTVLLTFNTDISSGWGGGAQSTTSGNTVSLSWHSAPETAEITVQADKNFNQLQCLGYSYSIATQ